MQKYVETAKTIMLVTLIAGMTGFWLGAHTSAQTIEKVVTSQTQSK